MAPNRLHRFFPSLAVTIISRLGHILSAQGVDSILTTLFLLFLAWTNTTLYGEVIYGIALGSVVGTIVEFGLYQSIVGQLSRVEEKEVPDIISRASYVKMGLLIPALIGAWGLAVIGGHNTEMAWIVFLVSLGFALEALAETFFADLRVRGRQDKESRIRMISVILGYGYGFVSVFAGFHPVAIGLYRVVAGTSRLLLGLFEYAKKYSHPYRRCNWSAVWQVVMAASAFALISGLGNLYNQTNVFFMGKMIGVQSVAQYNAGLSLVDPVSKIVSRFLLGLVLFPLLSVLWVKNREKGRYLILRTSQWLLVFVFPIMFVLYFCSDLLMGFIYPDELSDAIWIQQLLVWAIPFAFGSNLFSFVMIAAGMVRILLVFSVLVTLANLLLNVIFIPLWGVGGGCFVLILTKAAMLLLTLVFCVWRLQVFRVSQLGYPLCLSLFCLGLFFLSRMAVGLYPGMVITLVIYCLGIWKPGMLYIGRLPQAAEYDKELETDTQGFR